MVAVGRVVRRPQTGSREVAAVQPVPVMCSTVYEATEAVLLEFIWDSRDTCTSGISALALSPTPIPNRSE